MVDPWVRELILISVVAAFSSGLALALHHELFAAVFAAAAVLAGFQARPRRK